MVISDKANFEVHGSIDARCVWISEGEGLRSVGIWPPIFLPGSLTDDVRSLALDCALPSYPVVGRFYSFLLDRDNQVIGFDEFP